MPLIILGLIVVLGAALLIYYQLGPKVTLRLKSGLSGFGGGIFGGNEPGAEEAKEGAAEGGGDQAASDADVAEAGTKLGDTEGKVLFIFGDGESEVRPINEDGKKDEE